MRGLIDNDPTINDSFLRFFEMVQESAGKSGGVFFISTGDGDVELIGDVECETLTGWLVPEHEADGFERIWHAGDVGSEYDDKLVTVDWEERNGGIVVSISSLFE